MDDEFLDVFASNPKICKSMHMPLQSGSTRILEKMRRGYTKEWFLNRALKLRELVPEVSISTDIIVAFPGESEDDFNDTLEVLEEVKFEQIFSFKYSPRPLTVAATMKDLIDPSTASNRLTRLQKRHEEILDEITLNQKDKILNVYWEELRGDEEIAGRSFSNFLIQAKGDASFLGKISKVKITNPRRLTLYGDIVA
jgi:tRNA-2-methylthio-N6-dimethylallyladenosine synthase